MEGTPLAARIREEVADEVRELGRLGLVTLQVGEDPASTIYLRLQAPGGRGGRDRLG